MQKSFLVDLKKRKTEVRLTMVTTITCEKILSPLQDMELFGRQINLIEQDIKSIEVSHQLIMYATQLISLWYTRTHRTCVVVQPLYSL